MDKGAKGSIKDRRFIRVENVSFPIEYKVKDSNQKFKRQRQRPLVKADFFLFFPNYYPFQQILL